MQLIGVVPAVVFQAAGLGVSFVVRPALSHAVSFVKLMQQDKAALAFDDGIINPDLILGHELVNIVMAAFGKVDIEYAAHETPINNPDAYAVLQLLPEPLVHVFSIRQFLPVMGSGG